MNIWLALALSWLALAALLGLIAGRACGFNEHPPSRDSGRGATASTLDKDAIDGALAGLVALPVIASSVAPPQ